MKKLISVLILTFSVASFAQEVETLTGNETIIGGFGGPAFQATSILGQTAIMTGGEGAMVINHIFGIGGGGYGIISNLELTDNSVNRELKFGYGGVKFYYIAAYDKLFHFTASLLLGGGGVSEEIDDRETHDEKDHGVFVAVPAIGAEMNVTSYFRIEARINYRYVNGIESDYFSDSDFSGFSAVLFFKFGKF